MLSYNFKYEFKLLLRSWWIQLLSIVLLLLFGFSAFNGVQKVEKRQKDIDSAHKEVAENDAMMLKLLDSIEQGMEVNASRWTIPTSPMAVGNYHPRVAAMEPQPLAFLSTGQGDLFTHYVKPKASGDDHALNFAEMTSPVQLLFGSFDLAFVIVYLLPLLIIAFSYNVLSSEKESGVLRLLASQPIRIRTWVTQKLGLRFFWLSLIVFFSFAVVFLIVSPPMNELVAFLSLFGLTMAYMLFWFGLAFLINLWVGASAKNAVALLGLWIAFVLLIPSILNQLGNTIYPMPSRNLMINEMRSLKAEVIQKQDEILDNFLRDHPEYALNDTTQSRGFYHRYMASQRLIKEELAPMTNAFENQLRKQQKWVGTFKWVSPAIIVQESLNQRAGTSTQDYENYRTQVIAFAGSWRDHFMPFLYNNQNFSQKDYPNLPKFQFVPKSLGYTLSTPILLVISLALFGLGFSVSSNTEKNGILTVK